MSKKKDEKNVCHGSLDLMHFDRLWLHKVERQLR
jgi:hypothetical protein